MARTLSDGDLPGFWHAADTASLVGQKQMLWLTRARIAGLLTAATSGMFLALPERLVVVAIGAVAGFLVAFAAEVLSWVLQPERDWYSGRALAESTKTLAWRFAVGGEPFSSEGEEVEAERILGDRLEEVSREARDRVTVEPEGAVVTPGMKMLRGLSFHDRRSAYLSGRLDDQHAWYAGKAKSCRRHATGSRVTLIVGEVVAVTLAIFQVVHPWSLSVAGLASTLIGCVSAWVAVKQYSTLASAYSVTATELALLRPRVQDAGEDQWADVVDDAEEAISREHTLWLASRTGKAPVR